MTKSHKNQKPKTCRAQPKIKQASTTDKKPQPNFCQTKKQQGNTKPSAAQKYYTTQATPIDLF